MDITDSINYLLEFFTGRVLVVSATRKFSCLSLNFKEMFQSIGYILFHGFGLVSIRVFDFGVAARRIICTI